MLQFLLILAIAGLLAPFFRMVGIILLVIIVIGFWQIHQDEKDSAKILTFEQLQSYHLDCKKKTVQLQELEFIENYKHYDPNPDSVSGDEFRYKSLLKTDIWYLRRECQ
jgi:hypothetical protein